MRHREPRHAASPKAVIFDIGNVIVRVNPKRALQAIIGKLQPEHAKLTMTSPAQVWSAIEADPRWPAWQEGRVSPTEWHGRVMHLLGISLDFADFCAAWNRALEPETILPLQLFEQLGAQCKLALLSNTDVIHAAYLDHNFEFVHRFPVRIYSCAVGIRKPDTGIFQTALALLGVEPSDALYIDDIDSFVAAAAAFGLRGICFRSRAELITQLQGIGLCTEPH